jgi:hypothetical protein
VATVAQVAAFRVHIAQNPLDSGNDTQLLRKSSLCVLFVGEARSIYMGQPPAVRQLKVAIHKTQGVCHSTVVRRAG